MNELEESSEIFDLAQTLTNVPEVKEYLTRVNIFLITNGEIKADLKISDTVAGYTVFYMEKFFSEEKKGQNDESEITIDLVEKIIQWDKRNKRLKPFEYRFMDDLANGEKEFTERINLLPD